MKTFRLIAILLTALLAFSACQDDNGSKSRYVKGLVNSKQQWTYINLEAGRTVGFSVFGDTIADAQWAERTDWDIAICGEYIRTNGGTSGQGNAAIATTTTPYDLATRTQVYPDVDTIAVWDD